MKAMKFRKCIWNLCVVVVGLAFLTWATSSATAGWQEEWEKTLSAAKKEGSVAVSYHGGKLYRNGYLEFMKAYPDIKLEVSADPTSKYIPRVRNERRAGVYTIDVRVGGPRTNHRVIPEGVYAPLQSALILPEVLDDSKWLGGFSAGYSDLKKKFSYSPFANKYGHVWVNRDFVSEGELKNVGDLLNPKLKGKFAMRDPRRSVGSGNTIISILLRIRGKEFVKKFLIDQKPVFSHKNRQLAEWMARGQHPLIPGLGSDQIDYLKQQGVGLNIRRVWLSEMLVMNFGIATVALMDRAPHPNAAKVFINWYLSRQGQTAVTRINKGNSRRLDVPVVAPETQITLEEFQAMFQKDLEKNAAYAKKAAKVAKEILR